MHEPPIEALLLCIADHSGAVVVSQVPFRPTEVRRSYSKAEMGSGGDTSCLLTILAVVSVHRSLA